MEKLKKIALYFFAGIGSLAALLIIIGVIAGEDPVDTVTAEATTTTEATSTTEAPTTTVPPTTTTTQAPATTLSEADLDELWTDFYLSDLADWTADKPLNFIDILTEAELVELSDIVCDSLDDGLGFDGLISASILGMGPDWEAIDYEAMGSVVAASVTWRCDQHLDAMNDYIEQNS